MSRLFDALKSDTHNATLFAVGNSSKEIMKTLELRFDKTRLILEKIVSSIKELPGWIKGKLTS